MAVKPLKKLVQHEAYLIVFGQLSGVIVLTFLIALIYGFALSFSVFLGGMAYGLSNLVFVWGVFRFAGAHQMLQFVTAFFFGEMLKLILAAILFLVIVKYLPVSLLFVLIGFVGAIVSFWVVCMWHFSRQGVSKNL